uniref:Reverse transcriptase n=1 Tax=Mycena chlorophos TaxID=658473 RepID=A0ABQ0KY63_MYCCL|nr:predicted protein [Mycena chlorophos]
MLTEHFQDALKQSTPVSKPSPYTRRWWTRELSTLRRRYHKAASKARRARATEDHLLEMAERKREYFQAIRAQKRKHWKEWLEETTERSVWLAYKYAAAPANPTASRVPPLKRADGSVASSSQEKCSLLLDTFFPPPPPADLSDTHDVEHDDQLPHWKVTAHEILHAIRDLSPFKAPGNPGIPNIAIQKAAEKVAPILTAIANASFALAYHPTEWRVFTTITLRKPGKDDYSLPEAYRPIALEDTFSKVVESVVAKRLITLAEENGLLPKHAFGGRPGRTTSDAVLLLVQRIKDSWRRGEVTSALFLDISQAFPTVSHERLLFNLRKRRVPKEVVRWVQSFLSDRKTTLKFDDLTSEPRDASFGIPQGSPMSPVLYLFYAADLLEICDADFRHQLALGFIDDTAIVVSGPLIEANVAVLEQLCIVALEWSRTHACRFDVKKFQLLHFTWNGRKYTAVPVRVDGLTILPSDTAIYLGFVLDRMLNWKSHVERAIAKGTAAMLAVMRLTRPTVGMPHSFVRRLYISVVLPKMEYGLVAWYQPIRGDGRKKGSVGVATQLGRVQRDAVRMITGAFKTTATDVMEFHAFVEPVSIRLNRTARNNALKLASLPNSHPLSRHVHWCAAHYVRRHRTPLHELFNAFPDTFEVETIDPTPTRLTWSPCFTWAIAPSKDEAIKRVADVEEGEMVVYSDGSGYRNGVGAAAVAEWNGQRFSRRFFLGPMSAHTVFEGEVLGAVLALDIARQTSRVRSITIRLDNQACIQALAANHPQPGQYLIREFHRQLDALLKAKPSLQDRICITGVPGHCDVEGNKWADVAAKEAAEGARDVVFRGKVGLFQADLPTSVAARRAEGKRKARAEWKDAWSQSTRARKLAPIDKSPPAARVLRLYKERTRAEASIITQLRTGHIGLNACLHRIKVVDSPMCVNCGEPETVGHFLLKCRRYVLARHSLRTALPSRSPFNLSSLLSHKNITHTLQFLKNTQCFPQYFRKTPS